MRTFLFVLLLAGFLATFTVTVAQAWPPGSPISPAIRGCGLLCGGLSILLASWIAYAVWGRKRKAPRVRHRPGAPGSAPGFTLTELLAVLGIMLIVAFISIGTLLVLSEQQGPGAGAAVLQSAIVGARSHAVETFHKTRLVIYSDWKQDGSSAIERQEFVQDAWVRVRSPVLELPPGIYALKMDLSSAWPLGTQSEIDRLEATPGFAIDVKTGESTLWRTNRKKYDRIVARLEPLYSSRNEVVCLALTKAVEKKGECFIQFTPEGTLDWDSFGEAKAVDSQLVLVTMGGGRVTAWSSYIINSNTGTRLVFK